jgi:XTP/dITP diphosphohydrolase
MATNVSDLLVATQNQGKIRELRELLAETRYRLRGLDEFPDVPEAEETETTFAGNAALKAAEYARQTGLLTLADDSGLAVAVLKGAPGVYSARYGGPGLDDAGRVEFLLQELRQVPEGQRQAQFVCVMALATPCGDIIYTAEGVCPGKLVFAPTGDGGFGYDPIFVPEGYANTFGELPKEVKNSLSHRAKALKLVKEFLAQWQQDGGEV